MMRLAASTAKSSEAYSTGAPARSAPAAVEKTATPWRLGAVARGPRQALVIVRPPGSSTERWLVAAPQSESCPEAALLGLHEGLQHVRAHGAIHVTIVVFEDTLAGYLWRGWRPRSLRMHQALRRFLQATDGMTSRFECARPRQSPG